MQDMGLHIHKKPFDRPDVQLASLGHCTGQLIRGNTCAGGLGVTQLHVLARGCYSAHTGLASFHHIMECHFNEEWKASLSPQTSYSAVK